MSQSESQEARIKSVAKVRIKYVRKVNRLREELAKVFDVEFGSDELGNEMSSIDDAIDQMLFAIERVPLIEKKEE